MPACRPLGFRVQRSESKKKKKKCLKFHCSFQTHETPEMLAGNTLAAFNRALGPFLCGQIWGLLVSGTQMANIQFLPFAVVSALMGATCILYSCVRLNFD